MQCRAKYRFYKTGSYDQLKKLLGYVTTTGEVTMYNSKEGVQVPQAGYQSEVEESGSE